MAFTNAQTALTDQSQQQTDAQPQGQQTQPQTQTPQPQTAPTIVQGSFKPLPTAAAAPTMVQGSFKPLPAATDKLPVTEGEGVLHKLFLGEGTAASAKLPKGFFNLNPIDAFHVIQGSPLERAIQIFNPNFRGGVTKEQQQITNSQDPLNNPLINAAQFIDKDKHPMAKAVAEGAQSLTSPGNVAIMASTGGLGLVDSPAALGVANRLLSAGFSGAAIANAYKNLKGFKEAYDKGHASEAEYQLTHAVLSGAMGYIAGKHAATGEAVPTTAAPEEAAATAVNKAVGAVGEAAKTAAGKVADTLGVSRTFDNLVADISKPSKGATPGYLETVKAAKPDIIEVAKRNPQISTPMEMTKALDDYIQSNEGQLRSKAAETRGAEESVMTGVEDRVQKALNDYWSKNEGRYKPAEIQKAEAAVQELLGQGTEEEAATPNLFQAENVRQRFNDDTKPYFGQAPGTVPPAEIAAKQVAARALRDAIDEKYEELGIPGVKEWRQREARLIDVRDQIALAEKAARDAGEWSILKSLTKQGKWGFLPAIAGWSIGGPAGGIGEVAANTFLDYLRDYKTNPNKLTQRLVKAAQEEPSTVTPLGKQPQTTQVTNPPLKTDEGFGEVENPKMGAAATTLAPAIEHIPGSAILKNPEGEEVGRVKYNVSGDTASITAGHIEPEHRGQGYAQQMYLRAAEEAKAQGAKYLTSDLQGTTSMDAARVWDKLAEKGYPVEKIPSKPGSPGYRMDLSKLGETAQVQNPQSKLLEVPANKNAGFSTQSIIRHELGHAVVADILGIEPEEIRSHEHPEVKKHDGVAEASINIQKLGADEQGRFYIKDLKPIFVDKFVPMYFAGGVAQELIDGVPLEKNRGIFGDMSAINRQMKAMGFSEEDIELAKEVGEAEARKHLTKPGVLDTIRKYSETREDNLPDTLHMSKERVQQMLKEIKSGVTEGVGGVNREVVQGSNAPRAGESEEGNTGRIATETPKLKGTEERKEVEEPIRAYHGTAASTNFKDFETGGRPIDEKTGEPLTSGSGADPTSYLGAHFAKEPEVANKFAARSQGWMRSRYEAGEGQEGAAGPRVIPVDLRLKNPKDFGSEQNLRDFIYEGDLTRAGYAGDEILNELMRSDDIEEPEEGGDEVDKWLEKYNNDAEFRADQNRAAFEAIHRGGEEGVEDMLHEAAADLASQARNRLEKMGHDGAVYKNEVEGGTGYIAFDPKQIKSAFKGNKSEKGASNVKILPLVGGAALAGGLAALSAGKKKEEEPTTQQAPKITSEVKPLSKPEVNIPATLDKEAIDHNIPLPLFRAQAKQESNLDPNAVSKKGAKGVMQLEPKTADDLGVDIDDVEDNIHGGAQYMGQLHKRFKTWDKALAAYDAGPKKVQDAIDKYGDQWLENLPIETQNYVARILKRRVK